MKDIVLKPIKEKKTQYRCTSCGKFLAGPMHGTYPVCDYSCMHSFLKGVSKNWPPRKEIVSIGIKPITE